MWAEPAIRAPYAAPASIKPIDNSQTMRTALDALWRHKGIILAAGLAGSLLALVGAEMLPPRYNASAQLLVDPRDLRVLDKQVTPQSVATDSGISVVESQVQVLASDTVLRRAIAMLNLQDDPEFNGRRKTMVGQALQDLVDKFIAPRKATDATDPTMTALKTLEQKINVRRPERTFIIDLTVWTEDKDKSVRLADAIVKAYLEDQQQYRSEANSNAAAAIDKGLNSLRIKVSDSERRVAAYKTEKNLVGASGRLVGEQQLTEVNNQLITARGETGRAKARYDEIQASRGIVDALPEAVASPALRGLRSQLSSVASQRARMAAQMLPSHPAMAAVDEQEREIKKQIAGELQRIVLSARHEYDRAKATEDALARNVETLRTQMNSTNSAMIGLRELERDLEAYRSLYEQAIVRAREAREQSRVNTTNVRIISEANPARDRAFPPRKVVLLPAGLGLGLGFGLLGVLALHQLRRRPDPELSTAAASAVHAPVIVPHPASEPESGAFVFADLRGACRSTAITASESTGRPGGRTIELALTVLRAPMAPFARRMKSLHNLLSQAQSQRPRDKEGPMSLVLTSEGENEVKSAVALGLAYAAVAKHQRVLLVDGDLRNRRLSSALPEQNRQSGLEDVLSGRSTLEDAVVVRPDSQLEFLPATGKSNARQPLVLNASSMRKLLAQTRGYDLVIVESPALGAPSLGQTFAESFDDMLLVVGIAPKSEDELVEAMHILRRAAPKFRGVVVTD